MTNEVERQSVENSGSRNPKRFPVRLPGFVSDEEIGLGDLIKQATAKIGVKPCGGCQRRAALLNRSLVFSGRRRR
jgi:hypothetical protein